MTGIIADSRAFFADRFVELGFEHDGCAAPASLSFARLTSAWRIGFAAIGIVAVAIVVVCIAFALTIAASLTGAASGIAVATMRFIRCRIDAGAVAIGARFALQFAF